MSLRKGITLIELLVYIGVGTILMLAMSAFLITTLRTYAQADAYTSLHQESLSVLERSASLFTHAYAVDPSSASLNDLLQPGARLVMRTRDAASNPFILLVNNGVMQIQRGSDPVIPMHGTQFRVTELRAIPLSSPDGRSTHIQITLGLAQEVTGIGSGSVHTTVTTSFECYDYAP